MGGWQAGALPQEAEPLSWVAEELSHRAKMGFKGTAHPTVCLLGSPQPEQGIVCSGVPRCARGCQVNGEAEAWEGKEQPAQGHTVS